MEIYIFDCLNFDIQYNNRILFTKKIYIQKQREKKSKSTASICLNVNF
jgi:hypothetical protein